MLLRLRKFNIFWVGQGNDALKAPHHTRVEGDHITSQEPGWEMLRKKVAAPLKTRTREGRGEQAFRMEIS